MNTVGSSSVKLHTQGLENLKAYQGDSHKQNELTSQKFDLIFGCNLIDRLQYPRQWLLQSKVKKILSDCRRKQSPNICRRCCPAMESLLLPRLTPGGLSTHHLRTGSVASRRWTSNFNITSAPPIKVDSNTQEVVLK